MDMRMRDVISLFLTKQVIQVDPKLAENDKHHSNSVISVT